MLFRLGLFNPLVCVGAVLLSVSVAHANQNVGGEPARRQNLYSEHDLRGRPGPDLSSVRWLSRAPSLRGKVVVAHYFQSWSPNCREMAQVLGKWQAEFPQEVVAVGITGESDAAARDFVRRARARYPVGTDKSRRTILTYGVRGYPFVAVTSPDGIVRWQGWPNDPENHLDSRTLRQIVDQTKAPHR